MDSKCVFLLLVISVVYTKGATVDEEVKNSTTFTLDFYKSSFNANTNTVVSPISFRILLSLLYQSTSGDTEQELKDHVYFGDKETTAISQRLTLDNIIGSPNMKIVNRIYVRNGMELDRSFLARSEHYYSSIEQKDFSQSRQTANEINHFVQEETNGLIKNLVDETIFTPATKLILLNTLYFKANWNRKYSLRDIKQHEFHAIDGQTYNIDFMGDTRDYKFYDSAEIKAMTIELAYQRNSNAKFWIILPHANSSISELKDRLSANALKKIKTNLHMQSNLLWIPPFEIEGQINGVDELKKLGLNSLFNKAEIKAFEGGAKLSVSAAKQKVKIIVNTKGTEAASATYIGGMLGMLRPSPTPLFVNRPFIYIVLTDDSTEPLFIGHFSKPN